MLAFGRTLIYVVEIETEIEIAQEAIFQDQKAPHSFKAQGLTATMTSPIIVT